MPLGKDERRARYDRRRIETMQQALQARATIDTVILELEVSTNSSPPTTSWSGAARHCGWRPPIKARSRRAGNRALPGGGGNEGVLYLDQLLGAQDRVTGAELEYAEAQATAMVAAANLSRARGTLLADLGYDIARDDAGGRLLPTYRLVPATAGK